MTTHPLQSPLLMPLRPSFSSLFYNLISDEVTTQKEDPSCTHRERTE